MKNVFLMSFMFLVITSCNQEKPSKPSTKKLPFEKALNDLPSIDKVAPHKVLTLGVFHFDRSMDGSDVVAKNHIDISSAQNQTELDSLLRILKKFNPTRIAVEWRPTTQTYLDSLYAAYQNGKYQLGKNEAFQIGFKLANQLGLERVYCVDNNPPMPETVNSVDDWDVYAEELGHTELWHAYDEENEKYLTFMDTIQNQLYVFDFLKLINSEVNMKRRKQMWTTGLVNVGHGDKYLGADLLGRWYRRNSRIYVNAKNLATNEKENVLIIYGGAHKWILDELFESSPEFEVLQLDELF